MTESVSTSLLHRNTALPLTRALALVALLCVGALQVQEAGHGHWIEHDDTSVQCLVCKNSVGTALPLEAPAVQPIGIVAGAAVLLAPALSAVDFSPSLPRAPPYYS